MQRLKFVVIHVTKRILLTEYQHNHEIMWHVADMHGFQHNQMIMLRVAAIYFQVLTLPVKLQLN